MQNLFDHCGVGQDCCNMAEGLNLTLLTEKAGGFLYCNSLIGKTLILGKIESKRRKRMRWLDGITDSMDMSLSKFKEIVKLREALCGAVHGITKSQTQFGNSTPMEKYRGC